MLKTKLAGMHLPLQEAVARTITEARERMKLASAEKDEKVKKLLAFEKKEHGHIPSEKEEKEECKEKKSSALPIDPFDPEEVEKLAMALDESAEKLAADAQNLGKEAPLGGTTLPVQKPESGTQPYKKNQSKSHNVPMSTGTDSKPPDQTSAGTIVPTDLKNRIGGKYPAKGPLKTAGVAALKAVVEKTAAEKEKRPDTYGGYAGRGAMLGAATKGVAGAATGAAIGAGVRKGVSMAVKQKAFPNRMAKRIAVGAARGLKPGRTALALGAAGAVGGAASGALGGLKQRFVHGKDTGKGKQSSVDYILDKISASAQGGEAAQGGELVEHDGNKTPGKGSVKVPSNPGRQLIASPKAVIDATKREAKAPRKKELAEVLTEPAFSAAHDSKIQENLAKANKGGVAKIGSATKGGVKTAAAKALLAKIAEEGCTCDNAGTCRCCKLKAAMKEKKTAAAQA